MLSVRDPCGMTSQKPSILGTVTMNFCLASGQKQDIPLTHTTLLVLANCLLTGQLHNSEVTVASAGQLQLYG